jgi:hypothetical protein
MTVFKLLLILLVATGAAYMFVLRNRKLKFEVELEMDPVTSESKG